MLDYIVVGLGLSGLAVCAHLEEEGQTFMVIADGGKMASTVAGGVYNPVVLKRLTPTWNGATLLDYALPFYRKLEQQLDLTFLHESNILRRFASIEEQNNWYTAADDPRLSRFLSTPIRNNRNNAIKAPYGLGRVAETGRVVVPSILKAYADHLGKTDQLIEEECDFDALEVTQEGISYKNLRSKKLILAMGYRALENPWFNYLPIQGNKGEVLVIEAEDLHLETILKATDFVIPLGNHQYKVGASYNPQDLSYTPTETSRSRLLRNLEGIIACDYRVVRHEVGIRPTVPDRRPLLGLHPRFSNLGILNGMGSRGVLLAPRMARDLVHHMCKGHALDPVTDIKRYASYYEEA